MEKAKAKQLFTKTETKEIIKKRNDLLYKTGSLFDEAVDTTIQLRILQKHFKLSGAELTKILEEHGYYASNPFGEFLDKYFQCTDKESAEKLVAEFSQSTEKFMKEAYWNK